MKHFKIIAHTADIRLFVEGATLEELFNAALEGMAFIITAKPCFPPPYDQHHELTITSSDTTALLIDFLSEVLTQTHLNKTLYCSADFINITSISLHACIHGKKTNLFQEDIKAVTYHEADVKKNEKGNYQTTIVFDI